MNDIPDEVQEKIAEMSGQLVNEWVRQTYGKPVTLSLARLGILVSIMLQGAFRLWAGGRSEPMIGAIPKDDWQGLADMAVKVTNDWFSTGRLAPGFRALNIYVPVLESLEAAYRMGAGAKGETNVSAGLNSDLEPPK